MSNLEIKHNEFGKICIYKTSLGGIVQDYAITFNGEETVITELIDKTFDLFQAVFNLHRRGKLHGRLVAKVNFLQIINDKEEERSYHFSSYKTEEIDSDYSFFVRHMLKIAERMQEFNREGSQLLLKNISHIHILLSVLEKSKLSL